MNKKFDKIHKLTDNPFLNLYQMDALDTKGMPFSYYFASRNDAQHIKIRTKSVRAEGIVIYAVTEDWAVNGERGHNEMLYADPDIAKYMFNNRLKKELAEGCLERWKDKEEFRVESVRDLYEGYLDGGYDENHYTIRTEEKKLAASREFISSIYQISRRHIR